MEQTNKKLYILICLALVLATIIAFEGVRLNGFVYDTKAYITDNPNVSNGITLESIKRAFSTPHSGNWHSLTWISHMLDCQLFGLNPAGHHLVNVFFHIFNTLLLFTILKKITNQIWSSAFVAAAFALHPLHVESVAWVAERKDILSGLFLFLTIAAYIQYAKRPGISKYLLVVLTFSLGLLTKSMLVTLPCLLLLLDYWPLDRFQSDKQNTKKITSPPQMPAISCKQGTVLRLIVEKTPLFVLAVVSSVITFLVQQSAGAVEKIEYLPLSSRIANTFVSYVSYIVKMVYPTRLAVLYPHPGTDIPLWKPAVSALILIIISVAILYSARRYRFFLVGWLWYLGMLIPVIGIVQVGSQSMADRYTYLPSIGFFIIITWGLAELVKKWRLPKSIPAFSAGLFFVILIVCTRIQVKHWKNPMTLFGHALKVTKNNYIAHYNYADALCKNGQFEQAIEHFKASSRIAPGHLETRNNLGSAYYMSGKVKEAVECWDKLLTLDPKHAHAMNNLAWVRATNKNTDFRNPNQAIELALSACESTDFNKPDFLDTLAASYAAAGKFNEAVDTARRALNLSQSKGKSKLATQIQQHLRLYKAGKPYIDSPGAAHFE